MAAAAPRAGAELAAGSLATVAWDGPPRGAEEWEAFLSLDGGRTYRLRITPHLVAPFRHRPGRAAPAASSPTSRTLVSARLDAEPLSLPPVGPSVRLLTGRLNE